MPDEDQDKPVEKKKLPIKVIAIVAVMMLLEGAGVYLFVSMTGKVPQDSIADLAGEEEADLQRPIEIEFVKGKFQNMQTGRVWIWSIDIYLKVKKRDEQTVTTILENQQAEIREQISKIIRKAHHAHLKEPDLRTLNRQITTLADEVFGISDADGLPRVERVLIPRCEGHAVN